MSDTGSLKLFLKRGALISAANWPIVLTQFIADAVFKTLVAVPIAGGSLLVVLLVGGSPADILRLEPREMVPELVGVLLAHPRALAAFLVALGVVMAGGSVLMFAIKGGTMAVITAGEEAAGNIEHPPLRLHALRRASQFSIDRFLDGVRRFFPRFLRLGLVLALVYVASGLAYLAVVFGPAGEPGVSSPLVIIGTSLALILWIAAVNFFYLLCQIVIGTDDCSVSDAVGRAARRLAANAWAMLGILGAIMVLLAMTTAASILAIAALGFIAFVPFVGLAALPLQVCAWLVRGLVFQFIGLTGLASYLRVFSIDVAASAERRSA
jgi:hypothetical protein